MKKHTGKWVGVMLHHTAGNTSETVASIRKTHITKNKWGDIGYHYVLEIKDGKGYLKTGRSLKYQGAHAGIDKYNNGYIGLCVPGNYETGKMSDTLYSYVIGAICRLYEKMIEEQGSCSYGFLGHREVKATACPGKNVNLNKIRNDLTAKLEKTVKANKF